MKLSSDKRPLNVEGVRKEVTKLSNSSLAKLLPEDKAHAEALPKGLTIAGFAAIYRKGVRQAMLTAASLLSLFHRGDAANGIMQAVAFLDVTVGGEIPATT
jgi:hypothetical protein